MTAVGTGAAIFGCAGPVLLAEERAFFRDCDPFGFILFARNVETPGQLRRLTADLRDAVGRDAPILVDQEGGRVQRLRAPYWREWQPPLDTVAGCANLETAARAMRLRMRIIAAELRDAGIDANCAPVADVAREATHPFLKNRCYGTDAHTVSVIARAVADGLMEGGVWPVVKHMPGHGLSQMDTHHDLPTVTAPAAELDRIDFAPFRVLNDLPMAMTAHIVYAAHDSQPATQSPRLIRLIREEIGFGGLLMTDDLNMEALKGSLASRTAASLAAGCDIALNCWGRMDDMIGIAQRLPVMGPETAVRLERALAVTRVDGASGRQAELLARRDALLALHA